MEDKSLVNIQDNVCGALCRMIETAPHLLPLEQVLKGLMANLPLKKDMEESSTVYGCILSLWMQQNPVVSETKEIY